MILRVSHDSANNITTVKFADGTPLRVKHELKNMGFKWNYYGGTWISSETSPDEARARILKAYTR